MNDEKGKRRLTWRLLLRVALAIIGWFFCYQLIIDSATSGISRLFTTVALVQSTTDAADFAVKVSPRDPEAHYTRALTLVNLQRLPEAVIELRQAIQLRPHHYYQWLDLGVTLDRLGDQTGALAALRESVRLAPAFAQPRWQLGNFLFRQGLYDEAFHDLRLAVKSNPSLSEGMLELAWVAADYRADRFEALVEPTTSRKRFELAAFLSRQGRGIEAVNQVKLAGQPQTEHDFIWVRQTITKLIAEQKFQDAYAVWSITHPTTTGGGGTSSGQILNGDFTNPIPQNDPGFGWQSTPASNISVSIDSSGPRPGTRSIQIEYRGDSPPNTPAIQQLVLLEKDSNYTLSFMARSEELVTGGPPLIVVLDGSRMKVLGQSSPISAGTSGWTPYSVDLYVDETVAAASIGVQRAACSQNPCPIFGRLWLSAFVLTKK